MLQRAASNAYSWWWASHIRTKQSKWLEQNLQDLEEKVAYTLKLIEEDGDSFAKRAEMYYKKRPELISFVEEAYRAYRALAERYDHISTELQNANTTIARICPEEVPFMDEFDEDATPRGLKKPSGQIANIPKVPNMPKKDLKGMITLANKKMKSGSSTKNAAAAKVAKSGLTKAEGLKEIDKLQKEILALQTGKEFVKSSYESQLEKYWEIENKIKGLQQKICALQDEFGQGSVIEDEEARTLMAAAALNSCQETLAEMQEKLEKSDEEAKIERKRYRDARDKFESLKDEFIGNEGSRKTSYKKDDSVKAEEKSEGSDKEAVSTTQDREDLDLLQEKIREQFESGSSASLTVTEMVEKIDEVVSKVVILETSFSSQTSLIQRLRTETDDLQAQIRTLEDDKATLINEKKDLSSKLLEMEEKLLRLQDLSQSVEDHNYSLQTHLTEAHYNIDHLSNELQIQKIDEKFQSSSQKEEKHPVQDKLLKKIDEQDAALNSNGGRVQVSEEIDIKNSAEEKKKSSAKVRFEKETERCKGAGILANEDSHAEKPDMELKSSGSLQNQETAAVDEELKSSGSTQNEEKSPVDEELKSSGSKQNEEKSTVEEELKSSDSTQTEEQSTVKELKEQKEKLNHDDVSQMTRDLQTEIVNDFKERELSDTDGNQGEIVGQHQANEEPVKLVEEIKEDELDKQAASAKPDDFLNVQRQENREKTILAEYTTVLRNCKEAKKMLVESGVKTRDSNDESTIELHKLRIANTEKDEEIRSLRQKLSMLQAAFGEHNNLDDQSETPSTQPTDREVEIVVINGQQPQPISEIEERFRMDIDELLEENLDFWLRFSATFHQIQEFDTEVKDLQDDASKLVSKLEEKQKKQEGSSTTRYALKSDGRPLYKHLGEKKAELTLWMEKGSLLKEELTSRCSSLNDIQEEITKALRMSAEDDDFKFTSYQAAKFQGEVLNMKQENNKVAEELQAGLDHVKNLQIEVEKTLTMLDEKFGLSESKSQKLEHSNSKTSIPLRSFIFGVKQKKQRSSFFFSMNPALQRK